MLNDSNNKELLPLAFDFLNSPVILKKDAELFQKFPLITNDFDIFVIEECLDANQIKCRKYKQKSNLYILDWIFLSWDEVQLLSKEEIRKFANGIINSFGSSKSLSIKYQLVFTLTIEEIRQIYFEELLESLKKLIDKMPIPYQKLAQTTAFLESLLDLLYSFSFHIETEDYVTFLKELFELVAEIFELNTSIKCRQTLISLFWKDGIRIGINNRHIDWLNEEANLREDIWKETLSFMEAVRHNKIDPQFLRDYYHCFPYDAEYPYIIFAAIESYWKLQEEEFFMAALRHRLRISPALPLLLNSFPNILRTGTVIKEDNELLQKMMEIIASGDLTNMNLIKVSCFLGQDIERQHCLLSLRDITLPNMKTDESYFPLDYCREALLTMYDHLVVKPTFFYERQRIYDDFWELSKIDSTLFYHILFDVLHSQERIEHYEFFYILLNFLTRREAVRDNFSEYREKLKPFMTEESLIKMEKSLLERISVERIFISYFSEGKIPGESRKNIHSASFEFLLSQPHPLISSGRPSVMHYVKSHTYVVFFGFVKNFLIKTYRKWSLEQKRIVDIFVDNLHAISHLKQIFNCHWVRKRIYEILTSTRHNVPESELKTICEGNWGAIFTMKGKLNFEEYEYSTLTRLEILPAGGQATVDLVKVSEFPIPIVAKYFNNDYIQLRREIQCLLTMQCNPHIVSIYGYIVEEQQILGFLMEYCKGGSLEDLIKSSKNYREKEISWWTLQAACGLKFLSRNGIVHRDVKPANMLLDSEHYLLKISDLGISNTALQADRHGDSIGFTSDTGTFGYVAPEILNGQDYSAAVDVFGLGRSVWNLIYKTCPTDEKVQMKAAFEAERVNRKVQVSKEVWDFAVRMMNVNPEERPSIAKCYTFFRESDQNIGKN